MLASAVNAMKTTSSWEHLQNILGAFSTITNEILAALVATHFAAGKGAQAPAAKEAKADADRARKYCKLRNSFALQSK